MLQILEQGLDGGFPMLLVTTKMGYEKWNSGMFTVLLPIGRVIFSRIGYDDHFRWQKRIQHDHSTNGAIQAPGSCRSSVVSM